MNRESPLHIHLAIGVSRGERMGCVAKSTELGVATITPLLCERSEVRLSDRTLAEKKSDGEIIVSACEQSGRAHIPQLHAPMDFIWLSLR
ncbi:MAG: RsmE family RNA methyltransferase [Pseudomonadales bacterium]